jgi:N-acetylglucosaminyldiphosphoundecaprenol N-acetyl-beta-D-mannosaminyltransferase
MILGSRVDLVSRPEAIKAINSYIIAKGKRGMKMVVTAYSEFYVQATRDAEFRSILNSSDLVVPDGVSILAAYKYGQKIQALNSKIQKFGCGIGTGIDILRGRVGEGVTGVYLFEELTKLAAKEEYKVFLLGAKQGVAEKAAARLGEKYKELSIKFDAGEDSVGSDPKKNEEVIKKINDFKPELLFVAYNPIKQEKWLWENKDKLKVKVGMGVGGTFDEYIGSVPKAPAFMEQMGLKWLWRLILQPSRLPRIIRAVIVFPWLVFKESLKD